MFIASFPAGPWQTNCYVIATASGAECVVVDPGLGALDGVRDIVTEHHLLPVAALLTHGHLDHMYSVTPLCASYDATCWIHPSDRALLADPMRAMSSDTAALLAQLSSDQPQFVEPDEVRELTDGAHLEVAGVSFSCVHAPGHTAGSTMFQTPYAGGDLTSIVFSGDVVFAGSVGRTDLPGGSAEDMLRSLETKVLPLADTTAVLPGHGPQTTIGDERKTNPFLQERHLSGSSR